MSHRILGFAGNTLLAIAMSFALSTAVGQADPWDRERQVEPQVTRIVDVVAGEEVAVLTKAAVILLDDNDRPVRLDVERGVVADPVVQGSPSVKVTVLDLSVERKFLRMPGAKMFPDQKTPRTTGISGGSGLVIASRVRIGVAADATPGTHRVEVRLPQLDDLAKKHQAPHWRLGRPTFTFQVKVWPSHAALTADAEAAARQAQLGVDPHDARIAAEDQAKAQKHEAFLAGEREAAAIAPYAYTVLGVAGVATVIAWCVLVQRLGKPRRMLAVHRHEPLPSLCVCCGRPATVVGEQTLHRSGYGGPVVPLVAYGLGTAIWMLLSEMVAATSTHYATRGRLEVYAPFCHRHRNHWRFRRPWLTAILLLAWPVVVVASVAVPLLAMPGRGSLPVMMGAFVIALAGWPMVPMLLIGTSVRPAQVNERSYALTGVHKSVARAAAARAGEGLARITEHNQTPEQRLGQMTGARRL